MENLGYYNGKFGPLEEMSVPMCDRGCYFGDGVYEVAMVRNYKLYAFDEHIERFYSSASQLDIKIPYTKEELRAILTEMIPVVLFLQVFASLLVSLVVGIGHPLNIKL